VTPASESAFAKYIGANLVRARKRGGLSQDEVGFRAELHRTEVSQLERGLRVPRADTLVRLAAALSVDVNFLLSGIVWTPPSRSRGALTFDPPSATRVG
jgi:transcriptional regulator with XRE-family HTH domain